MHICVLSLMPFLSHGGGKKGNDSLHGGRGRYDLIGSESGLSSVQLFLSSFFARYFHLVGRLVTGV